MATKTTKKTTKAAAAPTGKIRVQGHPRSSEFTLNDLEMVGVVTYAQEFDWGVRAIVNSGRHSVAISGNADYPLPVMPERGNVVKLSYGIAYKETKAGYQHLVYVNDLEIL